MSGIAIAPVRPSKPGQTYYGYAFDCRDPKATHAHSMYGRCHIPSLTPPWTEKGITAAIKNDRSTYERAECWCRLEIVRSGPRGGWQHVNTKKQNHPARQWTGKRRMKVRARLAAGRRLLT